MQILSAKRQLNAGFKKWYVQVLGEYGWHSSILFNKSKGLFLIISHKYKYIFIKTVKTAGTSIEIFLAKHCGTNDVVTPIYPKVDQHQERNYIGIWNPIPEIIDKNDYNIKKTIYNLAKRNKFFNHIPAKIVKARLSNKVWNNYFKFCVERNPWDKTLSHYHMINDRAGGGITLEEYFTNNSFCINYPKYTDSKGSIIVDKVLKYESLNKELSKIFDKLGIPFDGALKVKAKAEHRFDRRPYQTVFTSEQKEFVRRLFACEIKLHGYVYDA